MERIKGLIKQYEILFEINSNELHIARTENADKKTISDWYLIEYTYIEILKMLRKILNNEIKGIEIFCGIMDEARIVSNNDYRYNILQDLAIELGEL